VFLAGTLTLVGPDGVASKPGLDGADGYYERDGRLPGNGPVEVVTVLAPGTWQLALDPGKFASIGAPSKCACARSPQST
jgi:hypothetical protein